MDTQNTNRSRNLKALAECAILVALATVLSFIIIWEMPQGGSITAVSMLPLVILGLRRGPKWSFASCLVYGAIQFVIGKQFSVHILSILFDYVFAFGMLGVAGFFRGRSWGIWAAIPAAFFGRFVCHFISGVIVWASYAPEGMPVWLYSILYNGGYMGVELILTLAVAAVLRLSLPRLLTVKD